MEIVQYGIECFQLLKCCKSKLGQGQNMNPAIYLAVVLATILVAGLFFALFYLALNPGLSSGLFCGIGQLYFGLGECIWITPWSPAFLLIWLGIFILLVLAFSYALFAFFIRTTDGPAILSPPIITPPFFVIFGAGMVGAVGWLIALDRISLDISLALNVIIVLILTSALTLVAYNYSRFRGKLLADQRYFEAAVIVIAVLNGMAMFISWLIYLAFVNARYIGGPSASPDVSEIIINVLGVVTVLYFAMDISVLERWTRFVITPYIVTSLALGSAIVQQRDECNAALHEDKLGDGISDQRDTSLVTGDHYHSLSLTLSRNFTAVTIVFIVAKLVNSFYNSYLLYVEQPDASLEMKLDEKIRNDEYVDNVFCGGLNKEKHFDEGLKFKILPTSQSDESKQLLV